MDDTVLVIASACVALAVLVYLMWRAATKEEWADLTGKEKRKWRVEEEERKNPPKK